MAGSDTSVAGSNANDWLSAPAHTLEAEACVKAFKTDPKMGLDNAQVAEYQNTFGPNKLKEAPPISFWSILVRNALNGECSLLLYFLSLCPSLLLLHVLLLLLHHYAQSVPEIRALWGGAIGWTVCGQAGQLCMARKGMSRHFLEMSIVMTQLQLAYMLRIAAIQPQMRGSRNEKSAGHTHE